MRSLSVPCVVRSKATFDTWVPRDLCQGELAYLYRIQEGAIGIWLHLISLDRPRTFTIHFPSTTARNLNRWFEVLV